MRRVLRAALLAMAVLFAAVAVYIAATLPPRSRGLSGSLPDTIAYGAYHIHSIRSDGSGTVDEIAAAAGRAGLKFIILTDHGDASRAPDPPSYRSGVLCIDAVEINTAGGHVVALGLRGASPYPLAGEPADVIEDIHRLGGFAIAAHPDSPDARFRWRGRNVPYDGLEWLNADSEWRDDRPQRLIATALRSIVRPSESIAALFDRPAATLQRWDAAIVARPVIGLAAVDAHANISWDADAEPRGRHGIARPSYEHVFRTVSQAVVLDRRLSGDPQADATAVLGALRAGRSFSIVRAIADPASLEFVAEQDGVPLRMGDRLPRNESPVTLRASIPQAPDVRIMLLHNGRRVALGQGSVTHAGQVAPGGYRVEAFYRDAAVPWIVSNPIYAGNLRPRPAPEEETETGQTVAIAPSARWDVEHDPRSSASVNVEGTAVRFGFALAGGPPAGQFAALAVGVNHEAGFDRVRFTARASAPIRLSVQVRLQGGRDAQRWRRSVYIDQTPQPITVLLRDFAAVGNDTTLRPFVAPLRSLLLVVDTLNTLPGSKGTIWISDVALGVGR